MAGSCGRERLFGVLRCQQNLRLVWGEAGGVGCSVGRSLVGAVLGENLVLAFL